ncbi:DUF3429 domain-containing protein [Dankookia sp. GCM10030260]|uniref:DUF3429 domain-containing protein n=1 Tax=Dankookia sp. GCM10030260 TaxID=3273390 RepID=UPI003612F35B
MDQPLPRPTLWLGLAGLLPFLGTALLAWTAPPDWRGVALHALAAYGAVILSFLGAVHWGLALRAPPAEAGATAPRRRGWGSGYCRPWSPGWRCCCRRCRG